MKLQYIISILLIIGFQSCKTQKKLAINEHPVSQEISLDRNREQDRITSVFVEANKEKILGNYSRAISLFRQCIDKDPKHAPSYYELARLYRLQFNMPEALKMAKKAVEIDPDNEWYILLLAELYQNTGQNSLAATTYRTLYEKHPSNLDYAYELANLYTRIGKFASAIEVYNSIERQTGIMEEISLQKQKLHLLSGNLQKAIEETEKLSDTYPDEPRYYSMLAELHVSKREFDKALKYYNKVLELDPENPYIRISLFEYYTALGDSNQAFEELKAGFRNPKLDIDTKIQVLLAYHNISEKDEATKQRAIELARILTEIHPEDPKSYSILADFLLSEGDYAEARKMLQQVVRFDRNRYVIWESLIRLHLMLDDFSSAVTDAATTTELFPLQPLPFLFGAIAYLQLEEPEKAISWLEKGKNLVVDDDSLLADFYMHLGDTYHQLKNHPKSDAAYEKSLRLKPDNPYVLNNFSYYLSLRKVRLDEAETMAKKANQLSPDNKHYLDTYGWVLYQQGKYEEAIKWIERSLQQGGDDNPEVLEHYGDVLYRLGRTSEAIEYWRKARETGKGSELLDRKIKDGVLYE